MDVVVCVFVFWWNVVWWSEKERKDKRHSTCFIAPLRVYKIHDSPVS